jgi:SAM-dependent methyltransferase
MEAATAPQAPPQAMVVQMALGAWVSKVISDVSRFNVPDVIKQHGALTAADLVSKHGIDAQPDFLERALRVCAGLGIFTEDSAGRFGPTEMSDVLTMDSPVSVKKFVEVIGADWFWRIWTGLGDAVRTGQPQTENQIGLDFWAYLNANPKDMEEFGEAMKSNSLNSLRGVLETCDLSRAKKVADVGGGFGHLAAALLRKYPGLRGVVIDVPDLIPIARKNLRVDDAVASRLEFMGGDMFESVPPADVYIMKHIIHDWDDVRCIRLLQNCCRSMTGDGQVVCVDAVLPPLGDTGLLSAKLLDVNMMVLVPGKERTRKQWEAIYEAAGLRIRSVTSIQDNFGTSIIEGVKR